MRQNTILQAASRHLTTRDELPVRWRRRSPELWASPAALVIGVLVLLSSVLQAADPPRFRVHRLREEDTSRITVDAREGKVAWSDVLSGLAASERLDEQALRGHLPNGVIDLNNFGAQATLVGLNLVFDGAARFSIEREDGNPRRLVIIVRRDTMRAKVRRVKSRIQQRVLNWRDAESQYTLELDEGWQKASTIPLAILIHGYTARPSSLNELRDSLRKRGVVTGTFGYPNDGAILPSGKQFAKALLQLQREAPNRSVQLIAHSMGGLVSRVALELEIPANQAQPVARLIAIAAPHDGSSLARVPLSVDTWEAIADGRDFRISDFILDGLNEARDDLRPESPFLRALKKTSRREGVQYSVIIGNKGLVPMEELDRIRRSCEQQQQQSTAMKAFAPRMNQCLADLDEITEGKGDGVVAVKRARLAGVDDTVTLPIGHWTVTNDWDPDSALGQAILQRATRRHN